MSVTIRVRVETDLTPLGRILTFAELPDRPRTSQVRAAVNALLADDGLCGCLRRYRRHLNGLTGDEAREHLQLLDRC